MAPVEGRTCLEPGDGERRRGEEGAPASALYNVARTFLTFAFGLALTLLMARWLGPSQYAVYALLTTFIVTGVALARLSLDTAASRFVAEMTGRELPADADRVASTLIRWEVVLCAVVCVGLVVASPLLSTRYGQVLGGREHLIVLAAIAVGPEAMGLVLAGVLKGFGRYGYLARLSMWLTPVSFGASLAAMRLGYGVAGLLTARVVISAVRVGLLRRRTGIRFRIASEGTTVLRRRLLGFIVLWSWLMVVDMVVWEQSELYFLGVFCSDEHVAFYHLAFSLSARAMALLPLAVGDVVIPTASRAFGRAGGEALGAVYRSSTRYLVFLAVPVAVGGMILAGPIVQLGAGADYGPAVPLLRVLLISASLGAIGTGSWAVLTAAERRRFLLGMGTAAALVNIFLDLLLIPRYAASGAVAANFTAQALPVTVGALYTCRAFRTSFPWKSVAQAAAACVPAAGILLVANGLLLWPFGAVAGVVGALVAYPATLVVIGAVRSEDVASAEGLLQFLPTKARLRVLGVLRARTRPASRKAGGSP